MKTEMKSIKPIFHQLHEIRKLIGAHIGADVYPYKDDFSFELSELYQSLVKAMNLIEQIQQFEISSVNPPNIEALLDLLIQLKIELYDEMADHCKELAQPLQEFINQVDAVDDLWLASTHKTRGNIS